jgi:single-strand DNA-binding protein
VLVEGRLTGDRETGNPRVFQRQDGSMGASYEISAERVVFLTGRDDQAPMQQDQMGGMNIAEDDDIPF